MRESSCTHSNSAFDFSCAPTHNSARGFNSLLLYSQPPLHLAIYQPTGVISCHVTECDWAALHSVVEQLAVRQVHRLLPSSAEVGVAT